MTRREREVSTNVDSRPAGGARRRRQDCERGSVLLESAATITILMMLLIGIFWIGRGFNTLSTMNRAAREGARFAVTPTCAMCGNQYPTDEQVRSVITASLQASALNTSLVNPNPIPVQRGVVLNPGSPQEEKGVVINFTYDYEIFLPFTTIGLSNFTLRTQVQMREEK